MRLASLLLLSTGVGLASAHAVITLVTGTNGVSTTGFGVVAGTLRTGTDEQPFQTDTSVLKDLTTDPCGATLRGGSVDIATNLAAVESQGGGQLPSLSSNLSITLSLHQVNADGGGPFTAMVNTDATGATWAAATITQQAPGVNALIRAGPNDAQVTAQLPAGTTCTGGTNGNACLIRLSNGGTTSVANGAGPFGGCFAVQNADSTTASAAASSVASVVSSTAVSATTTMSSQKTKNKGNKARAYGGKRSAEGEQELIQRQLEEVLSERDVAKVKRDLHIAILKRNLVSLVEKGIAARALDLTPGDLEDIKTATGTAVDIPIDALAGHQDNFATGGNSTGGITAANAILTFQQATDLKSAVQRAIAAALALITSSSTVLSNNVILADDTAAANALARQQLDDKLTTSVNAGNAGVGRVNEATVISLVGGLTEINTSEVVAGSPTPALTVSQASATAAAAAAAVAGEVTVTVTVTAAAATGRNAVAAKGAGRGNRAGLHKRRLPAHGKDGSM